MEEELPYSSDIAIADGKELQEIMENTVRSMEDLIAQLDQPWGTCLNIFERAFGFGQRAKEH